jgi:hypothetical protein
VISAATRRTAETATVTGRSSRRRALVAAASTIGAVALFLGYLRMSRTVPANADGASNALQAWEMLHGNLLLHGWTVTDVSFYTTELVQYMLVELIYGYHADVIHVAAAMTYTLLVLLAAAVAKGRSTGRAAVARVAVVVAIMLVPGPVTGYTVLLGSPDHFGTAVPLLVTWLVLDRATSRPGGGDREPAPRWLAPVIAVLLAWGMVADPLVMYIGALPLALISGVRLARQRRWRGLDAQLLLAAAGSVLLARVFLAAVHAAGGFHVHSPTVEVAPLERLGKHLWLAAKSVAVIFGSYFPELGGAAGIAVGVLKLTAIAAAATAVVLIAWQTVRRSGGDRVAQILTAAILVNIGAFVVSTLPVDLLTARQLVAILPLAAALAGRVLAPQLAARRLMPAVAALLAVFAVAFVVRATDPPVRPTGYEAGEWLDANGYHYGIGAYWGANVITLGTSGRVRIAPVTGEDQIMGYRWESHDEWYDETKHDARFILIDLEHKAYGTVETAVKQFGEPVERRDFGRWAVLRYDRNLLVGLPAYCVPEVVPRMRDCP